MLFILIFVHLLSQRSSAAPLSHPLDARTSTDSCDDINNCRKLFDIVWGCLATIFACTWVAVHPNVPPPDQSRFALLWGRLKMMFFGIIAPELMVGFAARQYLGSRELSTEFGFSRIQSFFVCMGGFVSLTGNPIASKEQLRDSVELQEDIRNVNTEDILDKSKGDALSKSVAVAQGLWFTTQCLARMHQRLAVTELEVTTLAFAVINIFVWLLWWDKPLDVQRPWPIVVESLHREQTPIVVESTFDLTSSFGSLDLEFRSRPFIPNVPLSASLFRTIGGFLEDTDYDLSLRTSVPLFWSLPMDRKMTNRSFGIVALAGAVFGAVHCAAWDVVFPSAAEMWLWRSCSLVIVAIPPFFTLQRFLLVLAAEKILLSKLITRAFLLLTWTVIPLYILARLMLIILSLIALRSPTSATFVDVNWSTYIPHI
ncbi:hypothetical protein K438DRAFT_1954222 [Mycena galopus ATCC 62051]|nr:hypothetical protein K438DRAFT_1954222 [Mycena galopus ATCC 62051]